MKANATPRRPTVLVVDDDDCLLKTLQSILGFLGCRALAAGTPEKALALAAAHAGEIDLLLTDIVMPGMNGYQLAESVDMIIPGIRVLFVTGYAGDHRPAGRFQEAPVLQKPFTMEEIAQAIGEQLESGIAW